MKTSNHSRYTVKSLVHASRVLESFASPGDVLRLILGQCARLAALGSALGLAAAFALTRFMESMLFGVKTTDAYTFAIVSLLLGAVALCAGYLPARHAMALHPAAALRHE